MKTFVHLLWPFLVICGLSCRRTERPRVQESIQASALSPASDVVGDANGDGVFDANDVVFMENALQQRTAQTHPGALSDVTHPCDGAIDDADLVHLRWAAWAAQDVRVDTPTSECHGGPIGTPIPTGPPPANPVTLDEVFMAIASEVPQFGGLYLDDQGAPVVALTEITPTVVQAVTVSVFSRFTVERLGSDTLAPVLVDYRFETLHGYRLEAQTMLALPEVFALDTDEESNRLWVGLRAWADRPLVEAQLVQKRIPLSAVRFDEVGGFQPQAGFDQFERPLIGGTGGAQVCTTGPILNRNGLRGMLTNAHCSEWAGGEVGVLDGYAHHQNQEMSDGSTLVGIESIDPPTFTNAENSACPSGCVCRWSDSLYADVGLITTTRKGTLKKSYNPASYPHYWVNDLELLPLKGDPIAKSGGNTGYTTGKVTKTCADWPMWDVEMLCQYKTNAESASGDSGSPVFGIYPTPGGTQRKLFGMHWGGESGKGTVFSPISQIIAEIGGSLDFMGGNDPPFVTVFSPYPNQTIGTGSSFVINLTTMAHDFEDGTDCTGCQVTWTSNMDGFLGSVPVGASGMATISVELFGPGTRLLTVEVVDQDGGTATKQIPVHTGNSGPTVWIESPTENAHLSQSVGVTFVGASSDPEALSGPLDCDAMVWTSSDPNDIGGTGCAPVLTFSTLGQRTITLTGTDPHGAPGSAQRTVFVDPLPATGDPIITWLNPAMNPLLTRDASVMLEAYATDPDGKSPVQYEWVLKGTGLIGATSGAVSLGTTSGGNQVPVQLEWTPANHVIEACGGIVLDLELKVTDADGGMASKVRQITVSGPLC